MKGFTYIDWFGTRYHFTYNADDGYWWNDEMKGDLYAVNYDYVCKYERNGQIVWDKEG